MALYLIGDVHRCDEALQRLLEHVDFSPRRDSLVLLGDLVNRGPDSLAVLRRLVALGASARCLLGNHDLHLLALACGIRHMQRKDTLQAVLDAPDRSALLHWLRHCPLALLENWCGNQILMVHAGVLPSWSAAQTMAFAGEAQSVLAAPGFAGFLQHMYGNEPAHWSADLAGADRLRVIVNVLTRLRFCTADDRMEFDTKEAAAAAPPGYCARFDVPGRKTANTTVAFGHWSTLGWLGRSDVLSLDTGCVWGGPLSALQLLPAPAGHALRFELFQVPCSQSQRPG
ncbi:MAG: symmetrical bis(5'-nucleosyl)-tetraphosphatase [Rhodoferax sp.]|nr:symmetrical bis(5'-nucleosyl)-tetraphosphatase [Rhodoferax sp.]